MLSPMAGEKKKHRYKVRFYFVYFEIRVQAARLQFFVQFHHGARGGSEGRFLLGGECLNASKKPL